MNVTNILPMMRQLAVALRGETWVRVAWQPDLRVAASKRPVPTTAEGDRIMSMRGAYASGRGDRHSLDAIMAEWRAEHPARVAAATEAARERAAEGAALALADQIRDEAHDCWADLGAVELASVEALEAAREWYAAHDFDEVVEDIDAEICARNGEH